MTRIAIPGGFLGALLLVLSAVSGGERDSLARRYSAEVVPILSRYCYPCHDAEAREGDLVLAGYRDLDALRRDGRVLSAVVRRVGGGEMPPDWADEELPAAAAGKITEVLGAALTAREPPAGWPGSVPPHRLNRTEYGNTVRDLLGIDIEVEADLPADDKGYGFDNVADVLSVSPLHLERYLAAAEHALDAALAPESRAARTTVRYAGSELPSTRGGRPSGGAHILFSNGSVYVDHEFETGGHYVIRASVWGDQAGPDPVRAKLRVDSLAVASFEVKAEREAPVVIRHPVRLSAGSHRIGVAFVNDYYKPKAEDPAERDRNLWVESIEIDGPFGVSREAPPESHLRIFAADPGPEIDERERARQIFRAFARRAFRRPAGEAEIAPLVGIFSDFRTRGDSFTESVRAGLTAVLVSPRFLFRIESDPEPGEVRALDGYELASRLSYFLWSSMPDEELLARAGGGDLGDPDVLAGQVRRMLADPRSEALVENFAGQWLGLRTLEGATPDPERFPGWSEALRRSMRRETELLFTAVMREDRSVVDLVGADFTYLDELLARHYGIEGVEGSEFRRVELEGTRRGGVLTQASILTLTSNPTRTSPVKRGKWILGQLLDAEPPPPPANVPALPDDAEAEAAMSLRERMRRHRKDPMCIACHKTLDPLGFALENFDAIGRWRDRDGEFPVDASGELPDGTKFRGPSGLRDVILSRRDEFVRALAGRLLTYAIGRGVEEWDAPALGRILAETRRGGYRFSALVGAIVRSDPFRLRGAWEEGR